MTTGRLPFAVTVLGTAVAALLPMSAPARAAGGSPGFVGTAAADGVRVAVVVEHFLVVSDIVDVGGPAAQAVVDALGDSEAYAAYPYPGEIVLTAHGLSQGAAPDYPLIAQSSNPTRRTSSVSQGPYDLQATSGEQTSAAVAQASAAGGDVTAGHTRSTAAATRDLATGLVRAESETTLEGLSFADVLRIGRLHSFARVTSLPGGAPLRMSETEIADVTVAGQQVGLTDRGLVLPGTDVPLPPDSTANAALVAAGVTVHYLTGYGSGPTEVAPGVAVTVVQDVPGVGRTTVQYTLGQVSATARAGAEAVRGLLLPGLSAATHVALPLPVGSNGNFVPPAGAGAPVTAALPAGAATTAPAPGAVPGAPQPTGGYRAAGLSSGPSSASLYVVVAMGAVLMIAAAQLFRVIAVRLRWS